MSYTPHPSSVAHQVLSYLIAQPAAELTIADIVSRFGVAASDVHASLEYGVKAGRFLKRRNGEGQAVWCLGSTNETLNARQSRSLEELGAAVMASKQRPFACALFSDMRLQLNVGGAEFVLMPTETTRLIRYLARMGEDMQEPHAA